MADEDLGTGSLTVELDIGTTVIQVRQLGEQLQLILGRASREAGLRMARNLTSGLVRVEPAIAALGRTLTRELTRASREAGREVSTELREAIEGISPLSVEIDADTTTARAEIRDLAGEAVTVDVDADTAALNAELARATRDREVKVTIKSTLDAFSKALGSLGKLTSVTLGIGALGAAAASTASSVAALVAALAPAAGILAALPAAALTGAVAFGALKLALTGVGDAFKEGLTGDAKAFEAAIKNLAPSARAAAKEVRALKPQFDALRIAVQGTFFDQFKGQITETAKALKGPLRDGLTGVSEQFGKATSAVLAFSASAEGVKRISQILHGTDLAVQGLDNAARDLTQGFLNISGVVAEAFGPRVSQGIQSASAALGEFLFTSANNGDAVRWVDGAITVFRQLGAIIGNVGAVLRDVFGAAGEVSGGFLGNLVKVTQKMQDFTESVEGQELLVNVFKTLSVVAEQFSSIVGALVVQLGAIIPSIAPLLNAIGPAITGVIKAIGPAVQVLIPGINALVEGLVNGLNLITSSGVLQDLAREFSDVLQAVAPLLPVVARLVTTLVSALVPVVSALSPVVSAAVGVISALATAISPLITVAGKLVAQLGPILTPVLVALGNIITQLSPLIAALADIIGTALGAQLSQLPALMAPFLDSLQILVAKLVPVALQLLAALQPALASIGQTFNTLAVALAPVLVQMTKLTSDILTKLQPLIPPLIAGIAALANVFASGLASTLTNVVLPALRVISAFLSGDLSGSARAFKDLIAGVGREVVAVFTALPRAILAATSGFSRLLFSAGADLIRGMIDGVGSAASALVNKVKGVVGDAVSGAKSLLGISSPSKVFQEIGKFTGQGLINGLDASASSVSRAAVRMAGSVLDPFNGNAPNVAVGATSGAFAGSGANSATFTPAGALTGSSRGAQTIVNNFTINEVGGGDATAQRIISRLVMAGGSL